MVKKVKEKSFFERYLTYQFAKGIIAIVLMIIIFLYILIKNLFE
jgi:hypothetical protein